MLLGARFTSVPHTLLIAQWHLHYPFGEACTTCSVQQRDHTRRTTSSRRFAIGLLGFHVALRPKRASSSVALAEGPPPSSPGVVILQVSEMAMTQEELLRSEATRKMADVDVGRGVFASSIGFMMRKTDLKENLYAAVEQELPASIQEQGEALVEACVNNLEGVAVVDRKGTGPFASNELLLMADGYSNAREHLCKLFDMFPETSKAKSKAMANAVTQYELQH